MKTRDISLYIAAVVSSALMIAALSATQGQAYSIENNTDAVIVRNDEVEIDLNKIDQLIKEKSLLRPQRNIKDSLKNFPPKEIKSSGGFSGLPVVVKRVSPAKINTSYRIKSGDTLSAISKKYGISIKEITSINKIKSNSILKPGQELLIPRTIQPHRVKVNRKPKIKTKIYSVKAGDTLDKIRKNYSLKLSTIMSLNPRLNPNKIYPGQHIRIPYNAIYKILSIKRNILAFKWPLKRFRITSTFGWRISPFNRNKREFHTGIDLAVKQGTKVYAGLGGRVIYSGWRSGYGNTVIIQHKKGLISLYAHNSSNLVKKGQYVSIGEVIARAGSTGLSTGPHVHFEIRKNGKPVNPKKYIR